MKMKTILITVLIANLFHQSIAMNKTLMIQNHLKKIVVVYLENDLKIEGKEIVFGYYDEKTLTRIIKKLKTNSLGEISILIPNSDHGASSIFSFALDEKSLIRSKAFRIPPDSIYGGQDSVQITISYEKKSVIKNNWAPLQYLIFPDDGTEIDINQSNIYVIEYDEINHSASNIKRMGFINGQKKIVGKEDIFLEGSLLFLIDILWEENIQTKKNSKWKTLENEEYSIQYPGIWMLNNPRQAGTSFTLYSGTYNEKVSLVIQTLKEDYIDLNKYVELSEADIKLKLENLNLSESERIDTLGNPFHKLLFSFKQGRFNYKAKQYYWVVNRKAYVLSFISPVSTFDINKKSVEKVMNSFKIK